MFKGFVDFTAEREGSFWCSHQSSPSTAQAEEKEEQSTESLLHIVTGKRKCKKDYGLLSYP